MARQNKTKVKDMVIRMNRKQRQSRRAKVAAFGRRALSVEEVAEHFGMSLSYVHKVLTDSDVYPQMMRRRKLQLHRKLKSLVPRIRRGETISKVAVEADVPKKDLSLMCKQMGVAVKRGPRGPRAWKPKRYEGVDWRMRDSEIARHLGITRSAVNAIRTKLWRIGWFDPQNSDGIRKPRSIAENR